VTLNTKHQVDRKRVSTALADERGTVTMTQIVTDPNELPPSVNIGLAIKPGAALFETTFKPRQFIIDGLMKRGDCALLAGRPKSGKSWLLLQLAQCIDTGAQFISKATTKASVLYIALEDGERRIHERLHVRKWKPKQAAFTFGMLPLSDGGMEQLRNAAQPFDVVVIDTLRAACGAGVDENDNAAMGQIMQDLATFAHDTEKTVIVSHHTRKGDSEDPFDTMRGAGAIRGAYDLGMVLQRKPKEAEAVVRVESRDIDADDMTLSFDSAAGWKFEGGAGRIEEIRIGRKVLDALRTLADDGKVGVTVAEISAVTQTDVSGIKRQLNQLEAAGHARREAGQGGFQSKPADRWYLA